MRVAAGVIRRDGGYLICRRRAGGHLARLWEFPGGKVEPGETEEACLVRELDEELGLEARVGALLDRVVHRYEDGVEVEIAFFEAEIVKGEPRALHHEEIRWVRPEEFGDFAFPDADARLLDLLKGGRS